MKKIALGLLFASAFFTQNINAQIIHPQNSDTFTTPGTDFWSNVRFGGGLGASFGNGYSDFSVSPTGIYQFTDKFAAGAGLQFSYLSSKDYYESASYGINLIGLFNPIPEFQLSAELEQLRVNNTYKNYSNGISRNSKYNDNFWNTGLFLGAGYRQGNFTIGVRYNVLYRSSDLVYSQAWMPFVRVYF